ncbi:MAG: HAD family hydrolase [Planctomycetaceae bacterium]|nr:HAD family hydrolase [Planctomycetaceae bacterium]
MNPFVFYATPHRDGQTHRSDGFLSLFPECPPVSQLGLDGFVKKHDFLIGIDSDGCAFDSMEIKHKECFIPNFIKYMGLQPISKYAREACEFTNLYSKTRGANRFPAYLLALDLLAERPEVQRRNAKLPPLQGVRDWVKRETKLGTKTIGPEAEKTGDPDLKLAYEWSKAVDDTVNDMVHGVPPFPGVREALQKMQAQGDLIVCSATPNGALQKEWQEHGIDQFVQCICGQESGSKKESLQGCQDRGYDAEKMLMIGDAPGDMKAAEAVGALFYPINPGHEEESWVRFNEEACDRFFAGTYAGDYQKQLIAEFDKFLPEKPSW